MLRFLLASHLPETLESPSPITIRLVLPLILQGSRPRLRNSAASGPSFSCMFGCGEKGFLSDGLGGSSRSEILRVGSSMRVVFLAQALFSRASLWMSRGSRAQSSS